MKLSRFIPLSVAVVWCSASVVGQTSAPAKPMDSTSTQAAKVASAAPTNQLHLETVTVPSELAPTFMGPKCDTDGNLYFRVGIDAVSGIRKLNPKGERVALFQAVSPQLKSRVDAATFFSLAAGGDLYQIIVAHELPRYVFVYKPDGDVRSVIKLQPGFFLQPTKVAAFSSGAFFVAGLEHDHDPDSPIMWPFEGIFSADGTLLKELHFEDDEKIHDMAASGDRHVVIPENPSSNLAVIGGGAEVASDGNVYLMRRLSPAIFYSISAGGEVRRFTVDPSRDDFVASSMHIAGNRIAVLFRKELTSEEFLKVVDLEGHEIATYVSPVKNGWSELGPAFACYALNPERFIFFTTMEDQKLGIITATPK